MRRTHTIRTFAAGFGWLLLAWAFFTAGILLLGGCRMATAPEAAPTEQLAEAPERTSSAILHHRATYYRPSGVFETLTKLGMPNLELQGYLGWDGDTNGSDYILRFVEADSAGRFPVYDVDEGNLNGLGCIVAWGRITSYGGSDGGEFVKVRIEGLPRPATGAASALWAYNEAGAYQQHVVSPVKVRGLMPRRDTIASR